ncbi:MAG: AI-2E family transporter [Rhodobacteraceae bacterium]|jgi:predicted PurR-regulated permease PerM|uniref:Putative permease n=1 Tax=Salipiger profundus TaxID=1229727 RepID=A0A1U7D6E0_9RHOB|nr:MULTISPECIES: AI-2E family transporter [Salipiger]APX23747.1 putative permease [Salipiger profundus]MAB07094.1 AI-2E family transporter [Paracoccaceae bacterium]GGA17677.1 AI-2E family transporter [Salipiger profundus]SFD30113.1 Predicted PurR-regulated permease PerM [Salipiger profundus]
MALPVRTQVSYWGIAAAVFIVLLWFLGDVLLPFVLGGAVAYFLDPVADRLERAGMSRAMATGTITVAAVLIFVILALAVVPALVRQTNQLVDVAPQLFRNLQAFLVEKFPSVMVEGNPMRETLAAVGDTIKERGAALLNTALTSAASLINILMLFVIVPVVAVYMLLDWDRMVARVDKLLPRDHAPVIRRLFRDIDATLAGFIRGMGSVCLILGVYYAVALWAVGLNFGLVVGVIAGMLTFIPYVGAIVGGALAIGLALFQFWGDWIWIAAVAGIFFFGQFLEGNFLTPKLVGNSVGLHPVWLIFALSVFGSLFGFIGMLVAVPLAAALGVVARFLIDQYTDSRLYRGTTEEGER